MMRAWTGVFWGTGLIGLIAYLSEITGFLALSDDFFYREANSVGWIFVYWFSRGVVTVVWLALTTALVRLIGRLGVFKPKAAVSTTSMSWSGQLFDFIMTLIFVTMFFEVAFRLWTWTLPPYMILLGWGS